MDWLLSMPLGFWAFVALGVVCFLSEKDAQRRIRESLKARDELWHKIINEQRKVITEAYEKGEPVRFTIQEGP